MYFDIIVEVQAFLESKLGDIEAFFLTKGGWEGWAQCELTRYLYNKLGSNNINLYRESNQPFLSSQPPITNLRSDFYIEFLNNAPYVPITMELKCESIYQEALPGNSLSARMYKDMLKLAQVRPPNTAPQDMYALGVTCSHEAAAKVLQEMPQGEVASVYTALLPMGGKLNLFASLFRR